MTTLFPKPPPRYARALARLRPGSRQPGWSLRYEAAVALMRDAMRYRGEGDEESLARARKRMDILGSLALPGALAPQRGMLAGVPCATVTPAVVDDLTVLYLHGGAYCFGSARSHFGLVQRVARHVRARTIALEYRLAPEHPCPAAIEDAVAALRDVYRTKDPARVVVGGDSAGGGLTLATLHALRAQGVPQPAAAFLFSPWVDLSLSSPSLHDTRGRDYLDLRGIEAAARRYAQGLDRRDPRVSPLFGDHQGLCPLLVLVGGAELLRDEGHALAERARAAGVPADLFEAEHEIHVWPAFGRLSPMTKPALGRVSEFVRTHAPFFP